MKKFSLSLQWMKLHSAFLFFLFGLLFWRPLVRFLDFLGVFVQTEFFVHFDEYDPCCCYLFDLFVLLIPWLIVCFCCWLLSGKWCWSIPSDVFLSSKGLQIYSQIFTNLFTNSQIKIFKLLKLFGLSTGFEIHQIALI